MHNLILNLQTLSIQSAGIREKQKSKAVHELHSHGKALNIFICRKSLKSTSQEGSLNTIHSFIYLFNYTCTLLIRSTTEEVQLGFEQRLDRPPEAEIVGKLSIT